MMSHPDTANPEPPDITTIPFQPDQWARIVKHINQQANKLVTVLSLPEPPAYVTEWRTVYNSITKLISDHPEATYYDSNTFLFNNPLTLYDYCLELLRMIPPLRATISVVKLRPVRDDAVELKLKTHTAETAELQRQLHEKCQGPVSPDKTASSADHRPPSHVDVDNPSDTENAEDMAGFSYDISTPSSQTISQISPGLKHQVDTMRKELDNLTCFGDTVKEQIDKAIKDAVETIMTNAQNNLISANDELKTSIRDGTTTAERLKGDLRTATDAVRDMRQQTEHLTQQATRARDVATREYAQARGELQTYHQQVMQDLQDFEERTKTTRTTPSPPPAQAPTVRA